MANASSRQIIDAWAQPAFKDGLPPEVVRVFEQSGSAHLLGQDLSPAQLVELMDKAGVDRLMLCAWHRPGTWVISNDTIPMGKTKCSLAPTSRNCLGRSVSNRSRR